MPYLLPRRHAVTERLADVGAPRWGLSCDMARTLRAVALLAALAALLPAVRGGYDTLQLFDLGGSDPEARGGAHEAATP